MRQSSRRSRPRQLPFPAAVRDRVAVNAMIPRLAPDVAAALALSSGCATIKVKVGDDQSVDRVAAVRSACGPGVRIRCDANGAWDVETAPSRSMARLAPYDIELVEDPVASLEELAALRRRAGIPVAAESCIRTTADARRFRQLEAADAIVLKPQRIGGVRAGAPSGRRERRSRPSRPAPSRRRSDSPRWLRSQRRCRMRRSHTAPAPRCCSRPMSSPIRSCPSTAGSSRDARAST